MSKGILTSGTYHVAVDFVRRHIDRGSTSNLKDGTLTCVIRD